MASTSAIPTTPVSGSRRSSRMCTSRSPASGRRGPRSHRRRVAPAGRARSRRGGRPSRSAPRWPSTERGGPSGQCLRTRPRPRTNPGTPGRIVSPPIGVDRRRRLDRRECFSNDKGRGRRPVPGSLRLQGRSEASRAWIEGLNGLSRYRAKRTACGRSSMGRAGLAELRVRSPVPPILKEAGHVGKPQAAVLAGTYGRRRR